MNQSHLQHHCFWPTRPWARLHLDYAGPGSDDFTPNGLKFSSDREVENELGTTFALPETIMADCGTCFAEYDRA